MALIPEDRPPIVWSWWERVRLFVGIGVIAALLIVGWELLIADIPGERAFNRFTGAGSPLWPTIVSWAVVCPLTGLAAAVLLPLFRYRYGAVIAGAVVGLVPSVVGVVFIGLGGWNLRTVDGWQRVIGIVGLAAFCALAAWGMRDVVLRGEEASSVDPPVT